MPTTESRCIHKLIHITFMHAHTHTRMHTHTCTHTHIHMHAHTHTHACTHTHIQCTHTYIYTFTLTSANRFHNHSPQSTVDNECNFHFQNTIVSLGTSLTGVSQHQLPPQMVSLHIFDLTRKCWPWVDGLELLAIIMWFVYMWSWACSVCYVHVV